MAADTQVLPDYLFSADRAPRPEPRKLRGLRFPVIPTGSWLAQVGGGIAALTGTWMQFGTATALMAGGLAAVVLGSLREAGRV